MGRYATPTKADIFILDPNKDMEDDNRICKNYTLKGKEDFLDTDQFPCVQNEEDIRTHAKLVQIDKSTRYYVKMGKTGRLFDPMGLFDEGQQLKQMRHAARPHWSFRQTSEKVFDLYTSYLKTKNPAHLHNAEREIL
jgi:hypothetical protein